MGCPGATATATPPACAGLTRQHGTPKRERKIESGLEISVFSQCLKRTQQACLKKVNYNPIKDRSYFESSGYVVSLSDQDGFCFDDQNPVGFIGGKAQDMADDVDGTD